MDSVGAIESVNLPHNGLLSLHDLVRISVQICGKEQKMLNLMIRNIKIISCLFSEQAGDNMIRQYENRTGVTHKKNEQRQFYHQLKNDPEYLIKEKKILFLIK